MPEKEGAPAEQEVESRVDKMAKGKAESARDSSSSITRSLALVATGVVIGLSINSLGTPAQSQPAPAADLRHCSDQTLRISQLEDALRQLRARALQAQPSATNGGSTTVTINGGGASPPPAPRQPWSWTGLVLNTMRPFDKLNGGITLKGLRLAEQKCKTLNRKMDIGKLRRVCARACACVRVR